MRTGYESVYQEPVNKMVTKKEHQDFWDDMHTVNIPDGYTELFYQFWKQTRIQAKREFLEFIMLKQEDDGLDNLNEILKEVGLFITKKPKTIKDHK